MIAHKETHMESGLSHGHGGWIALVDCAGRAYRKAAAFPPPVVVSLVFWVHLIILMILLCPWLQTFYPGEEDITLVNTLNLTDNMTHCPLHGPGAAFAG